MRVQVCRPPTEARRRADDVPASGYQIEILIRRISFDKFHVFRKVTDPLFGKTRIVREDEDMLRGKKDLKRIPEISFARCVEGKLVPRIVAESNMDRDALVKIDLSVFPAHVRERLPVEGEPVHDVF